MTSEERDALKARIDKLQAEMNGGDETRSINVMIVAKWLDETISIMDRMLSRISVS
jgi:hypothetical protein